jgi:hypothetical protein
MFGMPVSNCRRKVVSNEPLAELLASLGACLKGGALGRGAIRRLGCGAIP